MFVDKYLNNSFRKNYSSGWEMDGVNKHLMSCASVEEGKPYHLIKLRQSRTEGKIRNQSGCHKLLEWERVHQSSIQSCTISDN